MLDAVENREVEFKSLTSEQPSALPWKIMDKAKKFICACLNADRKGTIYFGVGDSQEQSSKFKRGEILGLDVEDIVDEIMKAFQSLLDDHIKCDAGQLQKGGDQNCINIEFVPVTSNRARTSPFSICLTLRQRKMACISFATKPQMHQGRNSEVLMTLKKCHLIGYLGATLLFQQEGLPGF